MEEGEEEFEPYYSLREIFIAQDRRVALTPHAVTQAMLRFGLTSDEAEKLILDTLIQADNARKRRDGALRWTANHVQVVTIQQEDTLVVITCYPIPLHRRLHQTRKRPWGKHKRLLKDAIRGVKP